MEFTAEVYFAAATERAAALQDLYESGQYALSLYVAGMAVESIFRAFRAKPSSEFESRHNLFDLAKESKFAEKLAAKQYEQFVANLTVVAVRWSNSHRYRSEAAILRYLKRRGHGPAD